MLNLIKKLKPNLGRYTPDKIVGLLNDDDLLAEIEKANHPKYLYFDEIKNHPKDIEPEKFWALVKTGRRYSAQILPMQNFNERKFTLTSLFQHNEILFSLCNLRNNNKLNEAAIIEIAIYCQLLEDKNIKKLAAKKMLMQGLPAKTESEKQLKQTYLLIKNILSLLEISAQGILDAANIQNFRSEDERFVYSPADKDLICYIAPPTIVFNSELQKLINFANGGSDIFNPLAKAIILMFWIIILKPLPQNNNALAIAVFYWYLKKENYEKLCLRQIIASLASNRPNFANAITTAAQDDNDYTYFQDFMINTISAAVKDYQKKSDREVNFEKDVLPSIQANTNLNKRQSVLIYELLKTKNARTNFTSYMRENSITRKTAADDLKGLEKQGYLRKQKIGKNIFYYADGLAERAMNLK